MKRSQVTLLCALGLQLLLIALFRSPLARSSTTPAGQRTLLAAVTPTKLVLGGSDEKPLTLEKTGDAWTVADLGGFPADGEKVSRVLDELKALTVGRPVVSSPRYHESFKVTDQGNEGRIRLWDDASGDPKIDLIIGDSPNYRITHVRLANEDAVYEARGLTSYDIRSATGSWIRKQLLDATESQVVGLVITNAAGSFELGKAGGEWRVVAPAALASSEIDSQRVEDLVRSVASLRLADAVGKRDDASHGFNRPAATVLVRWTRQETAPAAGETPTDLEETTIEVGGQLADSESQRYVGRAGFGFTGSIWESSVKMLIDAKPSDLLPA